MDFDRESCGRGSECKMLLIQNALYVDGNAHCEHYAAVDTAAGHRECWNSKSQADWLHACSCSLRLRLDARHAKTAFTRNATR